MITQNNVFQYFLHDPHWHCQPVATALDLIRLGSATTVTEDSMEKSQTPTQVNTKNL
jgi:hypothetical protein